MRVKMRMKKLITGIAVAVFLTFAVAGQAMAAFDLGNLQMVAYEERDHEIPNDQPGVEVHHDLGDSTPFTDLTRGSFTVDTGITLSDFDYADSWDDIYVGFCGGAYNPDYTQKKGFFSTAHEPFTTSMNQYSQYESGILNMSWYDPVQTPDANGNISYDKPGTYITEMQVGDSPGSYGGWLNTGLGGFGGESNLVDDGSVTASLWSGDIYSVDKVGYLILDTSGGSLVIEYTQVPIPAGVILLGSGLLGLVGIARKKRA